MSFIDRIQVHLVSGCGGRGAVHFKRTRTTPRAGPDGGDGGDGGAVILSPQALVNDLSHLIKKKVYRAENGKPGLERNKKGAKGAHLVLPVPKNTFCYNLEGKLLKTLYHQDWKILTGGKGGKGNTFFKTSFRQAPNQYQSGQKSKQKHLVLEMKWESTATLIGPPEGEKACLLRRLIGRKKTLYPYYFPRLYCVNQKDDFNPLVIVDLPGIYPNNYKVLKQAEHTKVILFVLPTTFVNPVDTYCHLKNILKKYDHLHGSCLLKKPHLVVLTKSCSLSKRKTLTNQFKKNHTPCLFFCRESKDEIKQIIQQINRLKETLRSKFVDSTQNK